MDAFFTSFMPARAVTTPPAPQQVSQAYSSPFKEYILWGIPPKYGPDVLLQTLFEAEKINSDGLWLGEDIDVPLNRQIMDTIHGKLNGTPSKNIAGNINSLLFLDSMCGSIGANPTIRGGAVPYLLGEHFYRQFAKDYLGLTSEQFEQHAKRILRLVEKSPSNIDFFLSRSTNGLYLERITKSAQQALESQKIGKVKFHKSYLNAELAMVEIDTRPLPIEVVIGNTFRKHFFRADDFRLDVQFSTPGWIHKNFADKYEVKGGTSFVTYSLVSNGSIFQAIVDQILRIISCDEFDKVNWRGFGYFMGKVTLGARTFDSRLGNSLFFGIYSEDRNLLDILKWEIKNHLSTVKIETKIVFLLNVCNFCMFDQFYHELEPVYLGFIDLIECVNGVRVPEHALEHFKGHKQDGPENAFVALMFDLLRFRCHWDSVCCLMRFIAIIGYHTRQPFAVLSKNYGRSMFVIEIPEGDHPCLWVDVLTNRDIEFLEKLVKSRDFTLYIEPILQLYIPAFRLLDIENLTLHSYLQRLNSKDKLDGHRLFLIGEHLLSSLDTSVVEFGVGLLILGEKFGRSFELGRWLKIAGIVAVKNPSLLTVIERKINEHCPNNPVFLSEYIGELSEFHPQAWVKVLLRQSNQLFFKHGISLAKPQIEREPDSSIKDLLEFLARIATKNLLYDDVVDTVLEMICPNLVERFEERDEELLLFHEFQVVLQKEKRTSFHTGIWLCQMLVQENLRDDFFRLFKIVVSKPFIEHLSIDEVDWKQISRLLPTLASFSDRVLEVLEVLDWSALAVSFDGKAQLKNPKKMNQKILSLITPNMWFRFIYNWFSSDRYSLKQVFAANIHSLVIEGLQPLNKDEEIISHFYLKFYYERIAFLQKIKYQRVNVADFYYELLIENSSIMNLIQDADRRKVLIKDVLFAFDQLWPMKPNLDFQFFMFLARIYLLGVEQQVKFKDELVVRLGIIKNKKVQDALFRLMRFPFYKFSVADKQAIEAQQKIWRTEQMNSGRNWFRDDISAKFLQTFS